MSYALERRGCGIDRVGGKLLTRFCHLLIAHDSGTAHRAHAELVIEHLLAAFAALSTLNVFLLIAGWPLDEHAADAVRSAEKHDPRIKAMVEFVADRVAELYAASDVAELPRIDGGTSGARVLALSMGLPAIVARIPDNEHLTGGEESAWLFDPSDRLSLTAALTTAAEHPDEARQKGVAARARAERLGWPEVGRRTAALIEEAAAAAAELNRTTPASRAT